MSTELRSGMAANIHPLRLLFVCGGNTCRSPMAAAIAREILGEAVLAESAGIAAYDDSATDEAIAVLDMKFGLNISEHHPRDVERCSPNDFDCVVAMDSYVSSHLMRKHPALAGNLVVWDIDDPT